MAKMPTIGDLRERLTFTRRYEVPTTGGATTETFTDDFTVSGKIVPVGAITRLDMAQTATPITHKAWVRYRDDITTRHWLEWKDRRFNIKGLAYMGERTRFIELVLEEIESLVAVGVLDEGG